MRLCKKTFFLEQSVHNFNSAGVVGKCLVRRLSFHKRKDGRHTERQNPSRRRGGYTVEWADGWTPLDMSGIRVSVESYGVTEKDLKIYFSKPENGGGNIKAIYFPLFYNDAVILFENEHVADLLNVQEHIINNVGVYVSRLPLVQAFPVLTAKVDSTTLKILQSTDEILDEVKHIAGLEYNYETETNEATLTGNWYQLEWAWAKIERFMLRQKHMERKFSEQLNVVERTSQLKKGSIPVRGDSVCPIISMPNTGEGENNLLDREYDTDIEIKTDVKGEDKQNRQKNPQTQDEVNSTAKHETKTEREELLTSKDTESGQHFSKTMPPSITREKHVSFKPEVDHKESPVKTEDSQKTLHIVNDRPDDMRSLELQYRDLTVHICTGEITMVETDVIVNAAMGPLVNAGGVAKAISSAASPDMQRECDTYVREHGSVPISEVMHTCAGGRLSSKVKHILHAVGPVWSSGSFEDEARYLLTRTFLNCFNYANNRLKVSSMTLPVISSGIFGCPLEICIQSFMDAILIFMEQQVEDHLQLKEVTLINNKEDTTALTVTQIREILTHNCRDLTKKAVRFYNKCQDHRNTSRQSIDVKKPNDKAKTVTQKPGTKDKTSHQACKESPKTSGRPLPPVPKTEEGPTKGKKK